MLLAKSKKGLQPFLVDKDVYEWAKNEKWHISNNQYVANSKRQYLHRLIKGSPDGYVDHINRNTLDNRNENLRVCNNQMNQGNAKLKKNNTSGYRGVYKLKNGKYQAKIMFNRKSKSLGVFDTAQEASIAYQTKAKELFGEFFSL